MTTVEESVMVTMDRSAPSFFKQWKAVIGYGAIGLVSLFVFGLRTARGVSTSFAVTRPNDTIKLPHFSVPSQPTAIALSVLLLALAAFGLR